MKDWDDDKRVYIFETSAKLLVEHLLPAVHRWLAKRGEAEEALHGTTVIRSNTCAVSNLSCPNSPWENHDATILLLESMYLIVEDSIAEVCDRWYRG